MGYHADVYDGIETLLVAALPKSIPVLNGLEVEEAQLARYAASVTILREGIDFEPHPEINPATATKDQGETWSWVLYVTGGGGGARPKDRADVVDEILETTQTALNAQRPTTDCGPMHLEAEDYEGRMGTAVMYSQRWRHARRP